MSNWSRKSRVLGLLMLVVASMTVFAVVPQSRAEESTTNLHELITEIESWRPPLYYEIKSRTDTATRMLEDDPDIQLMFVDPSGHPIYYGVNNLNAAKTIATNLVWPGSGNYSLDGSSTPSGQLAIWDAGGILLTHQEFGGRVQQIDTPSATHYHSTHVAGTMVAAGVQTAAKGMSPAAPLGAYDWNSDLSEMEAAAASGLKVSNHSYGLLTGWNYSGAWYWYGDLAVSSTEDYEFGYYSAIAEASDAMACDYPYYTIVKSAGNDRNDAGPGPGGVRHESSEPTSRAAGAAEGSPASPESAGRH